MTEINVEVQPNKYFRYLIYFCVAYFFFFIAMDLLRLYAWGYTASDFGSFNQVLWNSSNGDFFDSSIKFPFEEDGNWLGFHFSVLLTIIGTPFYFLFPYAETTIFLHVFACTVAAIPIFFAVKNLGLGGKEAFFWAVISLINPVSIYHAMFSLQGISFAIFFIALGLWAVTAKNFKIFLFSMVALILAKEHFGITVFGFGLLWAIYNKEYLKAALTSAIGLLGFYLVVFLIMPKYSAVDGHFMLTEQDASMNYVRYQWLNQPFGEVVDLLPEKIFNSLNFNYVKSILTPFAFILPIIGFIFMLPAGADFILIILSDFALQKTINYYYSATMIPCMVIASCFALNLISKKWQWPKAILIAVILIINVCSVYMVMQSQINTAITLMRDKSFDWAIGEEFEDLREFIKEDSAVMAQSGAGPFLSSRRNFYPYHNLAIEKAEFVLFRMNDRRFANSEVDEAFLNKLQKVDYMIKSPDWGIVYWNFPWLVFQKEKQDLVSKEKLRYEIPQMLNLFKQEREKSDEKS